MLESIATWKSVLVPDDNVPVGFNMGDDTGECACLVLEAALLSSQIQVTVILFPDMVVGTSLHLLIV
jgi:hypothetical protein